MNDVLADRLQLWGFEKDLSIFTDGSLGFGLKVRPLDTSCWEDDRINSLSDRVGQFLNGIPPKTDVQFIQEIHSGDAQTVTDHERLLDKQSNLIAQALCQTRTQRLRESNVMGNLSKHELKLFVRRPFTHFNHQKGGFFQRKKMFPSISEEQFKCELSSTGNLKSDLSLSLNSLGLQVQEIRSDELMRIVYDQWNPNRPTPLESYDPEDVRNSLLFTDVLLSNQGFSLADMHYRVLSLKALPEETFTSMATTLRGLPIDSSLILNIHVPEQAKELESLQTQRRVAYAMARGKKSGVSDLESEAKFQDLETLLAEMISQGERVFQVSLIIVLQSKDEDELPGQVALALSRIRELAGAEAMVESLASFDIFTESSIPNARGLERVKRVKTSTLVDFLPIYGPWSGHERPSILLRSRMGSLIRFNPFAPDLSNSNQVISGGSGSGKSFLVNILLLQMLKENPKVFIIDIGGSYKKLCDNLGGQYISLNIGSGASINPFELLSGETTPSAQKVKFLTGLIELMSKEANTEQLPKLERAELEDSIQKLYEKSSISKKTPRLSDLKVILSDHPEESIRRIGRILNQWCGTTPYGQWVDRDTTLELHKSIISFDLKGLESYPDLQSVCLFMITDMIWREVQKDRDQMKFLIFDECWKPTFRGLSGQVFV